jgi:hypothetical protein
MFAVMSASLAVSYHPAASRCCAPDSGSFDGGLCWRSLRVCCVVGVDLQLKLRSGLEALCAQALVQRLLDALQQRVQLVVLERRIESTIETSSGML